MNPIGFRLCPIPLHFQEKKKYCLTPSLSQKQKNQCIIGRCFNRSESCRAENKDIHINFRPLEINDFSKHSAEVKEIIAISTISPIQKLFSNSQRIYSQIGSKKLRSLPKSFLILFLFTVYSHFSGEQICTTVGIVQVP